MNRSIWLQPLSKTHCPPWHCSECDLGTLALVPKTLAFEESIKSVDARNDENFDPDWIEYSFVAWAQCTNAKCKQKFAISGIGGVAPEYLPNGDWEYMAYFAPRCCNPVLPLFRLPKKCPDAFSIELKLAFSLFWSAPSACAGRIRAGLEVLMTYLGVPKRKKGANGRISDLSLHARIDLFAAEEPAIGTQLMALKWLGNAGSHLGQVSQSDLLDAFEILEHALDELLLGRSKRVVVLARKLSRKHRR